MRKRDELMGRGVSHDATRTALDLPNLRRLPSSEGKHRARGLTDWVSLPAQHAVLEIVLRGRGHIAIVPHIERRTTEPFVPRQVPAFEVEVTSEDVTEHRLEIPLPDFTELRAELKLSWDDADHAPELLSLAVLSDPRDEGARLQILRRSADEVRVRVRDLPAPRLLVLSDADYPGWSAEVDGKRAAILRTADVLKGVELRAGSHDVRFYFRSSRLHRGVSLSVVALVLSVVLLWLTRPRRGQRIESVANAR